MRFLPGNVHTVSQSKEHPHRIRLLLLALCDTLEVPSDKLALSHLAILAAASEVPLSERLTAAIKGQEGHVLVTGPVAARQAINAYRVRLQLWQDDVLPTMAGFAEFVHALDAAGDQPVSMAVYDDPDRPRRFVLLLSADKTSLLGAVEIAGNHRRLPE